MLSRLLRDFWLVFVFGALLALTSGQAKAADGLPQLQNLDQAQAESAAKTFSSSVAFRPVEPASTYGRFWGVSAGVIGSATSTGSLGQALGTPDLKVLPGADIFLGIQA